MAVDAADPRLRRRAAKEQAIVREAWALAQRDGLAGISLRDLAERVDLRQPSLYAYFDSKLGLYDAMFADANRQLLAAVTGLPRVEEPREALIAFVAECIRFSSADVVRHQLLFQRTIPGFEPSAASFAVALDFYAYTTGLLAAAGVEGAADLDLFTALTSGLSHQQVANDPGGDRWVRLARRTVEMFLTDVVERRSNAR